MKTKLLKIILTLIFFSFLSSCITFKRNSTRKSKACYETFFINDSTMQYFIKPLEFKNSSKINIDFTFRKYNKSFSDVTMNFSCIGFQKNIVDTIYLMSNTIKYSIPVNKLMFKEMKKNIFTYRYNSITKFEILNDFFSSDNPQIQINENVYLPTKSTIKRKKQIEIQLFNFEFKE